MDVDGAHAPNRERLAAVAFSPAFLLFRLLEVPFRLVQRLGGIKVMPYAFLAPNLAFFGLFVLIPLFINFAFSFTGGTDIFLSERVYTGTEQYAFLFDCRNYLDPTTCREDRFWKAIVNTGIFVALQVGSMVVLSLITALILNRSIRGARFFPGGVLLSCAPFPGGRRADLEVDSSPRRNSECISRFPRIRESPVLRQP